MPRKPKTAGDQAVDALTADLGEGMEWSQIELLTLESIRTAIDRSAKLRELLDAETGKALPSSRRVTELAAEIRQCEASVIRWAQSLDPRGESVKSAAHQHAANARWGRRGTA
ncbi:hypothetical protein [Nocardia acidivorans]|uniref:hypothetical protein n=1 Tax=Nocardia acidivorans TaxID=404580 RepID=UPI000831B53A|nr:hypothetical protein [Nocardia acidivorans]